MSPNEPNKADIAYAIAKLKEVSGKIKEAIESIEGFSEAEVRSVRQFIAFGLDNKLWDYRLSKYHPLPDPVTYRNLQDALTQACKLGISVPYKHACMHAYKRVIFLTDIAENYINPFQTIKADKKIAREIIDEALRTAIEIEEKGNCSEAWMEDAWTRTKAHAYVYRVLKIIDPEKAKEIGDGMLKTADAHISEVEKTKGGHYLRRTLFHAVEVVSMVDAEKALSIAERIDAGSKERADALIYVLESYLYYLIMRGVRV